jgi:phage gp16-like protein
MRHLRRQLIFSESDELQKGSDLQRRTRKGLNTMSPPVARLASHVTERLLAGVIMPVDMCYKHDPHSTAFNTRAKLTKAPMDSKMGGPSKTWAIQAEQARVCGFFKTKLSAQQK